MALTDNLVAAWELNEASGTRNDSHGTNHLTDNNTVGAGTGLVYGNAGDFEEDNSEYLSIADNTNVSVGDIDVTWEAWVNMETLFFTAIGGQGNTWSLVTNNAGKPFFWVQSLGVAVAWGSNLSTSTWYQIIWWHDSVNNQLGITVSNGTPVTASYSSGLSDVTDAFWIGRESQVGGGANYMDGLLGPVRMWKRVLTSDERTQLYNGGAGLAYADFGGGGGGHPAIRRTWTSRRRPVEIGRKGVHVI